MVVWWGQSVLYLVETPHHVAKHSALRKKMCNVEMFTRQAIIINVDVKGIVDDDDGENCIHAHTQYSLWCEQFHKEAIARLLVIHTRTLLKL